MKTILVDDNLIEMQGFELECGHVAGIQLVGKFTSPIQALEYVRTHTVHLAILDIDMPEMNGLELCDKLKAVCPGLVIVFATAHPCYAVEAIRKQADCIVFKPYDSQDVESALSRARLLRGRMRERVCCQTFGRFDVFVEGAPMVFKSAKAKEILALCVYRRGAPVASEELVDKLWPDYNGSVGECSAFRFTIKQLMDTLKQYHAEEIFSREKGLCYINRDRINCDYFDFLNDDEEAICQFQGEFMGEYSWAEMGLYALLEKKKLGNAKKAAEKR